MTIREQPKESLANSKPATDEIPALPPGVTLAALENGLTLILREDHSAPVVSAQAWCMAGSIHESQHLGAGLSHALEHMLFKGTTNRPGNRIDQEVQEAGGYMNAYTSFDRTVYHIDVPSSGAKVAIDILCDIMQNATIPADELEKEKQVILREMDMNMDDPGRRASRRLFETAYTRSPYRFTVIGYPDLFGRIQRDHLVSYYQDKYAPNNVFYVVAGDINPAEVQDQIARAYAKSEARCAVAPVLPAEPSQTAPREVVEEGPVELAHMHFCWHIPDVRHPDVPLLDVLAALLGHGRSSRLYRRVRQETGLVHSVDAWTYNPGEAGLLGISAVLDGLKFSDARAAILAEIYLLLEQTATTDEIEKAIKQFTAATLSIRKTMQGQAQDLGGSWLTAGNLNFSKRYLSAVQKATPHELQRVARKYLTAENRTLYALLPQGARPRTGLVEELSAEQPTSLFCLENGLRVLVKEDHRLPFVQFRAVLRGGASSEQPATSGLTQLTTRMLLKGTRRRTAEQIALAIEGVGGSIDTYSGNNSFGVSVEVMRPDFLTGLDLLSDVLLNPIFDPALLERERTAQLASIRSQKDQMLQMAFKEMRRGLFGEASFGLDTLGTEESVQRFSPEDLKAWRNKLVAPANGVLAVFGDVDPATVRDVVSRTFADWNSKPDLQDGSVPLLNKADRRIVSCPGKKQAVVVVGFHGLDISDPRRYALDLVQEACSDLGSRLFMRIRDELGLAYYVGAQNLVGVSPGYFAFYAGTSPEHVDQVERELLAGAASLATEGLTADELRRAKAKVVGQRKIARQDLSHLAMTTALDELYGLGYRYGESEDARYESVSLEQARAVAQEQFLPDRRVIAIAQAVE